jgi:bud site selection protein 31
VRAPRLRARGSARRAAGVGFPAAACARARSRALAPAGVRARRRYIYELFYKEQKISAELYEFLARHKIIDTALISKWRKPGYEILCSMSAINKITTNFGTSSICRVPLAQRSGHVAPSHTTGCVSCASGDGVNGGPIWWTDPHTLWAARAKKRKAAPASAQAGDALDDDVDPDVARRLKALRDAETEDPAVAARLRALRGDADAPGPAPPRAPPTASAE